MRTVYTEIEINAPAEKVWNILTDFPNQPKWNPIIASLKGTPRVGGRLLVLFKFAGIGTIPMPVKVLVFERARELTWIGRAIFPGILDGRHSFIIEPLGPSKVKFVHLESFSGIALRFAEKILDSKLKANYESMNIALKALAEKTG